MATERSWLPPRTVRGLLRFLSSQVHPVFSIFAGGFWFLAGAASTAVTRADDDYDAAFRQALACHAIASVFLLHATVRFESRWAKWLSGLALSAGLLHGILDLLAVLFDGP